MCKFRHFLKANFRKPNGYIMWPARKCRHVNDLHMVKYMVEGIIEDMV